MSIQFEWDDDKNAANQRKHGISFEEAQTAFYDEQACLIADPEHSEDEERFVLIGMSEQTRLLMVSHCYRSEESVIRLISARKASKREQRESGRYV